MEKLNAYARVPCGFAAVQDVRTGTHEDRLGVQTKYHLAMGMGEKPHSQLLY